MIIKFNLLIVDKNDIWRKTQRTEKFGTWKKYELLSVKYTSNPLKDEMITSCATAYLTN